MLNLYQKKPDEFRRVVAIIAAGMTQGETYRFLSYRLNYMAQALNLPVRGRSRQTLLHTVWRKITTEQPSEPYIDPALLPPPPPQPDIECCEPVPGATLRWAKADKGEAVTYSVDRKDAPNVSGFSTKEIDLWFSAWSDICGIRFERTKKKGDIHIQFLPIDGPGKTLGFAWQPSGNAEFMEQAGDLSGDITIDTDERSWPLWMTRTTGRHEVGHAIGLEHSARRGDLLFGQIAFGRDVLPQTNDITAAVTKYPLPAESIAA